VHAWVNVNLVAGAASCRRRAATCLPAPEWLMVPRALAEELAAVDPQQPGLPRPARALRPQPVERARGTLPVAGVASLGGVHDVDRARHRRALRLDGIHLDYIRYPTERLRLQPRHADGRSAPRWRPTDAPDRRRYDARPPASR
jgi:hypothetical protein